MYPKLNNFHFTSCCVIPWNYEYFCFDNHIYSYAVLKYHQIGSCRFSQPGNEIKYIFKCTFETCCSIIICSNSGDMVLEVFVMSTNIGTCVIWNTILNLEVVSIGFQAMIFFRYFKQISLIAPCICMLFIFDAEQLKSRK